MWDNIVGDHIRRTNRNLLEMGIGILIGLAVTLAIAAPFANQYFYNFFFGPFPLDREALASGANSAIPFRYFVDVEGAQVLDTGFDEVETQIDSKTKAVKSSRVTATYVALTVDDRLLVAKVPPGYSETRLTGELVGIPDSVRSSILNKLAAETPELSGAFFPFMLDGASEFRVPGCFGLFFVFLLLIPSFLCLTKAVTRWNNLERHPVVSTLRRYGSPLEIADEIDRDVKSGKATSIPPAFITDAWFFHAVDYSLSIARLSEIVWIYIRTVRTNFVPTAQFVIVLDCHGKKMSCACNWKEHEVAAELYRRAPWILMGYDKQIIKAWKSNREGLIRSVADKRDAILSARVAAAAYPAPSYSRYEEPAIRPVRSLKAFTERDDLEQAIALIKSGEKADGQQLLIEVLKTDPKNDAAWVWMSAVVDTDDMRRECLEEALKFNPSNRAAALGLEKLRQKPYKPPAYNKFGQESR